MTRAMLVSWAGVTIGCLIYDLVVGNHLLDTVAHSYWVAAGLLTYRFTVWLNA